MDKVEKIILLISPCCGKGYLEAAKLAKNLSIKYFYHIFTIHPTSATNILEKFSIDDNREPKIYCEGLLIPTKNLKDPKTLQDITNQILKINILLDRKEGDNKHE